MNWTKPLKIISNAVYTVGLVITLCLGTISLFGSNETIDSTVMIPYTWKELAFIWLALGTIPMLLACIAVYKFNTLKNSTHKKRNLIFIFLPGFVCSACALFVIGTIIVGMINTFVFQGENSSNSLKQLDNVKPKEINAPTIATTSVEDQLYIQVKNLNREIDIKDSILAEELIKAVDDSEKIVSTGASCPFGNQVTIYKNQEVLKEFFIANDGCNTIKRTDNKIMEIEKTTYKKIEDALQSFDSSLIYYSSKKK